MSDPRESEPSDQLAQESAFEVQAKLLRARIEAELGAPAVVMVTSACVGDGKSLTAYSLAESLAACGHSVALVSRSCEELQQVAIVEMSLNGKYAPSREPLKSFVEGLRREYDFTIIDAETFAASSAVVALANLADGILLAVRIGRAPTANDEVLVEMIERSGGRIVGVVATDSEDIAALERAHHRETGSNRSASQSEPEAERSRASMIEPANNVLEW